jgi:hypothetical protein
VVVASRTEVVQSIQNNVKRLEPRYVELRVFDVGVDGMYLDVGIECRRSVCRNLSILAFRECCVTHMYPMDHTRALLCFTSFLRKRN